MLDRYEYQVEVKGGFRQLVSKNIVITTNVPPEKFHNKGDEDIKQLLRRIDYIYNFDDPGIQFLSQSLALGNTTPTLNYETSQLHNDLSMQHLN